MDNKRKIKIEKAKEMAQLLLNDFTNFIGALVLSEHEKFSSS